MKCGWEVGTPKSARSTRDVPLGRSLTGEPTEYLSQHPRRNEPEAPFWPGRVPGGAGDVRLLDYDRQFDVASRIRFYFKPALAELGVSGTRWHDLRHFYTSVCAAAGIEIRKVSRWMGPANINITDSIYTHLFDGLHPRRHGPSGRRGTTPRDGRPGARHRRLVVTVREAVFPRTVGRWLPLAAPKLR